MDVRFSTSSSFSDSPQTSRDIAPELSDREKELAKQFRKLQQLEGEPPQKKARHSSRKRKAEEQQKKVEEQFKKMCLESDHRVSP